jgi:hypothetical protein
MNIAASSTSDECTAVRLARASAMADAYRRLQADPATAGLLTRRQSLAVSARVAEEAVAERPPAVPTEVVP